MRERVKLAPLPMLLSADKGTMATYFPFLLVFLLSVLQYRGSVGWGGGPSLLIIVSCSFLFPSEMRV